MTVLWMTGLSGAGKTTLAKAFQPYISNSIVVDGDVMRGGLCSDLGFDQRSRKENMRRLAHVSKFLDDSGLTPIVPVICPTNELRNFVADIIGSAFCLIYVKCDLETCKQRDVKGLYAKVARGEIKDFTGIDSLFEEPLNPDLVIETKDVPLSHSLGKLLKLNLIFSNNKKRGNTSSLG